MKALKNESKVYFENIISAIEKCYADAEPTNSDIMSLYNEIGRQICLQGEKAFVSHLEKLLKEKYPQLKGFSARNIRRMRDFYLTYENNPLLMEKAKRLNFTINSIILEHCESDDERAFYLELAEQKSLSKISLITAIEIKTHLEVRATDEITPCDSVSAPVCDFIDKQVTDTTTSNELHTKAILSEFEILRQGCSLSKIIVTIKQTIQPLLFLKFILENSRSIKKNLLYNISDFHLQYIIPKNKRRRKLVYPIIYAC